MWVALLESTFAGVVTCAVGSQEGTQGAKGLGPFPMVDPDSCDRCGTKNRGIRGGFISPSATAEQVELEIF